MLRPSKYTRYGWLMEAVWPLFPAKRFASDEPQGHNLNLRVKSALSIQLCHRPAAADNISGTKLLLFDICLDLKACSLSYFWKERSYDGLLLQPALLTQDHGCSRLRVMLAVCREVSVVEHFKEENPPSDTVSDRINLWCISSSYLLS